MIELQRSIFEIDGRFDAERIFEGNIVPLMDSEGHRLNGTVAEVNEKVVVMDMNHPLAGSDLIFIGKVLENRPATNEEIQGALNLLSGEGGCGCGCDHENCDSGCDCGH